jgi:hypothetical protein
MQSNLRPVHTNIDSEWCSFKCVATELGNGLSSVQVLTCRWSQHLQVFVMRKNAKEQLTERTRQPI